MLDVFECRYCKYYFEAKGECRKHAPEMVCGSGTGWSDQLWPEVLPDDWCGDYVPALDIGERKRKAAELPHESEQVCSNCKQPGYKADKDGLCELCRKPFIPVALR